MSYAYAESGVTVEGITQNTTGANGIHVFYAGADATPQLVFVEAGTLGIAVNNATGTVTVSGVTGGGTAASAIVAAWASVTEKAGFSLAVAGNGTDLITAATVSVNQDVSLDEIRTSYTQIYNQIKAAIAKERVVLPPSGAIAGLYARVDRNRGVWKAPANESLANVLEPILKIDNTEQARLNVDATSGKSINAIRSFAGKGVIVWGARTLAGNDNEWRYINVRRLFILIEESVQKASSFVVFEGNDATTWLKVKAMVESFLYGLWQQGALAGPTAEAAYFVNVGLGKTMTTQDILEGRLIVEIGVAAVRPAEFIVLRFFHKLQEA
jgi:phage tail sheath protein FI